jgi:hypothetical protein
MDAVSQFLEGEQIYFKASLNLFYSFFRNRMIQMVRV